MAELTQSEGFHVTLPSNASLDLWPDNVLNHYRTKLAQRMDLPGAGWEVGLAELNYSRTWSNVNNNEGMWITIRDRGIIQFPTFNPSSLLTFKAQAKRVLEFINRYIKDHFKDEKVFEFVYLLEHEAFQFRNHSNVDWTVTMSPSLAKYLAYIPKDPNAVEVNPLPNFSQNVTIKRFDENQITNDWWITYTTESIKAYFAVPPGYYKTPEQLVGAINDIVTYKVKPTREVCLEYDTLSRKVKLKFPIVFHKQIKKVDKSLEIVNVQFNQPLGGMLGFDPNTVLTETTNADRVIDMDAGLTTLFVYCDLVSDSVVGDTLAPLLRVSQITAKDGDYVNEIYVKPYYRKLARQSFETVLIYLTDEAGRPIQFQTGRVTVTLHFRRRP
jgi:hypothetical protein